MSWVSDKLAAVCHCSHFTGSRLHPGRLNVIPVAKSSDRIGRELDGWREGPDRRSDGFASLAVKERSRGPTWNESDKTLGNPYKINTHRSENEQSGERSCAVMPGAARHISIRNASDVRDASGFGGCLTVEQSPRPIRDALPGESKIGHQLVS
jgi:hypothetical protein